jgi:26S proteasome regulatory subunit N9
MHRYCTDRLSHDRPSLKLIRGTLDQVDQKAQITWVQPRVLSRDQIGQLERRLSIWVDKLNTVEQRIAPEVLVGA